MGTAAMQRDQKAVKECASGEGELTSLFRRELVACGDPDVAAARVERRMHLLNVLAAAARAC